VCFEHFCILANEEGNDMTKKSALQNKDYAVWLKDLKSRIRTVQLKAAVAVNAELLRFYWELGADIVDKQKKSVWGEGFLAQLSGDLISEFPDMKGFSVNNLQYIRRWFLFYNDSTDKSGTACSTFERKSLDLIASIPWGHNLVIISKATNVKEALFYVRNTIQYGWSRSVLVHQIESGLYKREGNAVTNFKATLPAVQSDLAHQTLKDPYCFDFLTLRKEHDERELEDALVDHLTKFLLELGAGFSFLGRQYRLEVGGDEFFVDLLFYHVKLHCYVVVELKTVPFKPEFAGKLNFYISAVDGELKSKQDNPTVGILICKSKNNTVVEYALKDVRKPIGVSEYAITKNLPKEFRSSLPSIEEIERELGKG
jgi:predicted nuclease of restriction endonuclease-like (RecB) superfamily